MQKKWCVNEELLEEEIPEMLEELHNWILPSTKSEVFNGSS
jgi:hypothetical protein